MSMKFPSNWKTPGDKLEERRNEHQIPWNEHYVQIIKSVPRNEHQTPWNEHQGVLSEEQSPTGKGNVHQRYPDVQRVADETVTFLRSKPCNPASHVPTTQGMATSNASIPGETGRLKGQAMLDFRSENVANVPHEFETTCCMSPEPGAKTRQTHTMQPIGQDGRPSTIPKLNLPDARETIPGPNFPIRQRQHQVSRYDTVRTKFPDTTMLAPSFPKRYQKSLPTWQDARVVPHVATQVVTHVVT